MYTDIKNYYYLDANGIESIYTQILKSVEHEKIEAVSKGKSASVKGKMGLNGLISKLFSAEVGSEVNVDKSSSYSVKTSLSTENKLDRIVDFFKAQDQQIIFFDVESAIRKIRYVPDGYYVYGVIKFNLPQFYNPSLNGVDSINKTGQILYEYGGTDSKHAIKRDFRDTYDYSDHYFKRPSNNRVIMSNSLSKMTRTNSGLGHTSHEGVYFRGHGGLDVPIGVFGRIVSMADGKFYQIKPFALWW